LKKGAGYASEKTERSSRQRENQIHHDRSFTRLHRSGSGCFGPYHRKRAREDSHCELDGKMAMAVLPANRKIVLQDLREVTGSEEVKFASEEEFQAKFPGCETGAMPPFGNLYGMDVYLAESLSANDEIVFNAGSHTEVIRMRFGDFERLVRPKVVSFTT